MDYGFVSCIPILVLITGALLTKKIGESMIVASSDVIFMTVAGTGVSNVALVKTITPYALIGAVLTAAGYLLLGFI